MFKGAFAFKQLQVISHVISHVVVRAISWFGRFELSKATSVAVAAIASRVSRVSWQKGPFSCPTIFGQTSHSSFTYLHLFFCGVMFGGQGGESRIYMNFLEFFVNFHSFFHIFRCFIFLPEVMVRANQGSPSLIQAGAAAQSWHKALNIKQWSDQSDQVINDCRFYVILLLFDTS